MTEIDVSVGSRQNAKKSEICWDTGNRSGGKPVPGGSRNGGNSHSQPRRETIEPCVSFFSSPPVAILSNILSLPACSPEQSIPYYPSILYSSPSFKIVCSHQFFFSPCLHLFITHVLQPQSNGVVVLYISIYIPYPSQILPMLIHHRLG